MNLDYKYELSGKLIFDPIDLTKKHVRQSEWKKTAIVLIDNLDFCKYYCWFIFKRYNLDLQMPHRGLHFTVINDKVSDEKKYRHAKNLYNGRIVTLNYDIDPRTDDTHWWLNVKSEDGETIRTACGLPPIPYWGFHITIGRADGDLRIEHNKYIHHLIKKFGKEYK